MAGALGLPNGVDLLTDEPDEAMENGENLFAPDSDMGMEPPNISSKVDL